MKSRTHSVNVNYIADYIENNQLVYAEKTSSTQSLAASVFVLRGVYITKARYENRNYCWHTVYVAGPAKLNSVFLKYPQRCC